MNKLKRFGLRILSAISVLFGGLLWMLSCTFMVVATAVMCWAYGLIMGFCDDDTDADWNGLVDAAVDCIDTIREYFLDNKMEL